MDGAGIFSIGPSLFFKGFLGSNYKKNHDTNGLETKIFVEYFYKPFEKILHSTFSTIAEKNLPEITNFKVDDPPKIAGRYTCVFLYFNTIFLIFLQRNIVIYTNNFFLKSSFDSPLLEQAPHL